MDKTEKQRVVEELAERLGGAESLIVADYRGLTNAELAGVRRKLAEHGASFTVVKNTLTRRAAEAAGTESLLALLEGPTAIAFVETDGDPIAVAKALSDTAKETKILSLRGGVLSGKPMVAADVEELAKLPAVDVLKSQLVGVIVAPLTQLAGLLDAPLRNLVGLIDARIAQLQEGGEAAVEPAAEAPSVEAGTDEPPAEPDQPVAVAEDAVVEADEPVAEASEPEADGASAAGETDGTDESQEDDIQEEQD